MQAGVNRQGSQVSGLSNPLGNNHPVASEASAGLRQTVPAPGMQLPLGSVITHPSVQSLAHHPGQLPAQLLGGHFQQHLPSSRAYQSFTQALTDASQPLTASSTQGLPPHGFSQGFAPSQGFFSQPMLSQGQSLMTNQGFSQPQQGQGSSLQSQSAQGFFLPPQSSQSFFSQSQGHGMSRPGQGSMLHSNAGLVHGTLSTQDLPNGIAHAQTLPDGSAHLPSSLPGTTNLTPHPFPPTSKVQNTPPPPPPPPKKPTPPPPPPPHPTSASLSDSLALNCALFCAAGSFLKSAGSFADEHSAIIWKAYPRCSTLHSLASRRLA